MAGYESRKKATDERLLMSFVQRAEVTAKKLELYASLTESAKLNSFFKSQADINRTAVKRLTKTLAQISKG